MAAADGQTEQATSLTTSSTNNQYGGDMTGCYMSQTVGAGRNNAPPAGGRRDGD
ncbi:hypothetical protein D083_4241 [Dickeya solani RNS 08.23.3.1.A]|nr:hypothetical protein D083_4241 [Dickeya solani RNS 08.23.3.1.A]